MAKYVDWHPDVTIAKRTAEIGDRAREEMFGPRHEQPYTTFKGADVYRLPVGAVLVVNERSWKAYRSGTSLYGSAALEGKVDSTGTRSITGFRVRVDGGINELYRRGQLILRGDPKRKLVPADGIDLVIQLLRENGLSYDSSLRQPRKVDNAA